MRKATGRQRRWPHAALVMVLLLLPLGLLTVPATEVAALSWPGAGKRAQRQEVQGPGATRRLQEVAPPGSVQQFRASFQERAPRLAITSPAPETLMPPGAWTLRLQVEDWPLVEAGALGLGPHLVVQLDTDPPRRITTTELEMPPLAPGSHRLTVYAAWPWGEAVKDPGAWQQLRLHRVVANPLSLPVKGSPQLLAVSPAAPSPGEPVLLDWLLIDTPLQNLRPDDASWRLRVTVNGDSFLIDRQTPLWLRGWQQGSNALQLELVDPRGEPLNPPFNSLVTEVMLGSGDRSSPWLKQDLPESDLARLRGEAPPEPPAPDLPVENAPPAAADPPAPGEGEGAEISEGASRLGPPEESPDSEPTPSESPPEPAPEAPSRTPSEAPSEAGSEAPPEALPAPHHHHRSHQKRNRNQRRPAWRWRRSRTRAPHPSMA